MTTPRFVVSLTTSPKRLPHIGKVIQTIYSQNVKPDKIYLNIPSIFKRTGESYPDIMPEELSASFNNIVWNKCGEDVGPGTKLHGTLQVIPEDEDVWIITIDDDILYLPYTIEMYARTITTFQPIDPKFAMGLAGFEFRERTISPVLDFGEVDILEGYGSACYHRSFFNKSWTSYLNKCIENKDCRLSDDIFISNWLSLRNIKRVNMSAPWISRKLMWANKCILSYGNESDALHNGGGVESTETETTNNIVRYGKTCIYLHNCKLLSKELLLKVAPPSPNPSSNLCPSDPYLKTYYESSLYPEYCSKIVSSYKQLYADNYLDMNKLKNQYKFFCYYYLDYIRNIQIPTISLNLENEAVLVEFRSFPHLEYTLRNAIMKLGNLWSYTIVCGTNNFAHVANIVQKISGGIRIIKMDIENISESEYSKLLTTVDFWKQFHGSKILIYQEDAAIFKTNIDPFLQYDYIGAPWAAVQNDTPNLVGNGGFSLRSKRVMIDTICAISPQDTLYNSSTHKYMINTKSTHPPEDVYFSKNIQELNLGVVADYQTASDFSTESVVNVNSFGGHCFWVSDMNWRSRLYNSVVIQFVPTFSEYFNKINHRGGWKTILFSLMKSHFYNVKAKYMFFDTLDFYFISRNNCVCTENWGGIIHSTPYTPPHLKNLNIDMMFSNPLFIKSLPTCFLLITLSDYLAKCIREKLLVLGFNTPVISMKHPIEEISTGVEFSLDKYTNNSKPKLIQIGQQLRKITSIYRVNLNGLNYKKMWLTGDSDLNHCSNMLKRECISEGIENLDLESVKMYYTETFEEYDDLLSQNVCFIDLYDAAANNVVLECILRSTPLIVNKVGGVVEYLGNDYPLYFENLDDVPALLADYNKISAAHYYLKQLDKSDLTIDRFKQSLFTSIHQTLGTMIPLPN